MMYKKAIEIIVSELQKIPDDNIDDALAAVAVFSLISIRERRGLQFLKEFCESATNGDLDYFVPARNVKH